jgi:hypothetical protein
VIATGARARTFDSSGSNLNGIHYLRSTDDSRKIRQHATPAKRAVVVGAGFIGMEVASALAQKGLKTTMVLRGDRIWDQFFTPETSRFFEGSYTARGVKFEREAPIESFSGDAERKLPLQPCGQDAGAGNLFDARGRERSINWPRGIRDAGIAYSRHTQGAVGLSGVLLKLAENLDAKPEDGIEEWESEGNTAVRRYHPGQNITYGYLVIKAKKKTQAEPSLVFQTRLYRNGMFVYTGPSSLQLLKSDVDPIKYIEGGQLRFNTEARAGEYLVQVPCRMTARRRRNRRSRNGPISN